MEPLNSRAPRWPNYLVGGGLLVTVVLPLAFAIVREASQSIGGGLTSLFFRILFGSVAFTLTQATLGMALAVGAGIFLGTALAFVPGDAGRRLARATELAGLLCFTLPGATVALLILDLHHELNFLPARGLWAVVAAHVFLNALFMAASVERRTRGWLNAGGIERLESSALLGASGLALWRNALGTLWLNEIKAWAPLVFLWSFSAFSTVLILGGSPGAVSPEVLLFYSLQNDPDSGRILVLTLVQVVVGGAVALWWARANRGVDALSSVQPNGEDFREPLPWVDRAGIRRGGALLIWLALMVPVVWLLVAPALNVALRGIPEGYGRPFAHSVILSALTAIFSLAAAALISLGDSELRKKLFFLGGFSTTLLASAWMGAGIDLWFVDEPLWQIPAAAFAISLVWVPVMALWIENRIQSLPREWFESAALLGASPMARIAHVTWPLMRDLFSRIALVAALAALGELAITGLFLRDWEVAAGYARKLADRYDFAGASLLLLFMLTFTLILMGLSGLAGRTRRFR